MTKKEWYRKQKSDTCRHLFKNTVIVFQIPDTTVTVTQQFGRGIHKKGSETYNNLRKTKWSWTRTWHLFFLDFVCLRAFCMLQVNFYIIAFVVSGILGKRLCVSLICSCIMFRFCVIYYVVLFRDMGVL